jgi:hypothetical protein
MVSKSESSWMIIFLNVETYFLMASHPLPINNILITFDVTYLVSVMRVHEF